jgi:hypothetical protein
MKRTAFVMTITAALAAAHAAAPQEQAPPQEPPAVEAPAPAPLDAPPPTAETQPPDPNTREITEAEFEKAVNSRGFNHSCLRLTDAARGIMAALAAANGQKHTTYGTGFSVEICTPANWIARKMAQAKRQYRSVAWADLLEQDRVRVLHVLALPDRTTNLNVENGDDVAHVVLRHPDKKKRETIVVQPLFKRPFGVEQQNNLGGQATLEGIDAAFPFDTLAAVRDEKGEFLVTVVGDDQEKNFKVKQKHLDDLGMR